eukprot:Seg4757.2 transcript_id=Seg4757.2/GoldUCD/mRNA.D3Y31 product="Nuclear factor NF-kappa-B p100 subunit" protein_id=Seg4757.2/GoldUCD/D3Y31
MMNYEFDGLFLGPKWPAFDSSGKLMGEGHEMQDLLKRDGEGDTILHIATAQNKQAVVAGILRTDARKELINAQNDNYQTALHIATIEGHSDIVNVLLQSGALLQLRNNEGDTSIHLATRLGKIKCLMILCQAVNKEALNMPNDAGELVLHLAVAGENHQAFQLFLEKGADVNLRNEKTGKTALHFAVEKENKDMVKRLLELEADVNAQTTKGNTPLHSLLRAEQRDTVILLLEKGADINAKNKDGKSPHDLADKTMQRFMTRNRKDRKTRRPKRPKGATATDSQPEPETSTTPKPVFDRTNSNEAQSSKKPFTPFTPVQSHPGKKPRLFEDGAVANTSQDTAAPAQRQFASSASVDHSFELDVWGRRLDTASLTRGNSDEACHDLERQECLKLPFTAYKNMSMPEFSNGKVDVTNSIFGQQQQQRNLTGFQSEGLASELSRGMNRMAFSEQVEGQRGAQSQERAQSHGQYGALLQGQRGGESQTLNEITAYLKGADIQTRPIATLASHDVETCLSDVSRSISTQEVAVSSAADQSSEMSAAIALSLLPNDAFEGVHTSAIGEGDTLPVSSMSQISSPIAQGSSFLGSASDIGQFAALQSQATRQPSATSQSTIMQSTAMLGSQIDQAFAEMGVINAQDQNIHSLAPRMPALARNVEHIARQLGLPPADVFLRLLESNNKNN